VSGWLALSGAPDERGFWPILVAALASGLLLARDRRRYSEALLDGMAQPLVLLMITAWLLAGVLSTLLGASGFVDALVWTAARLGLSGGGYVAAAFLVCGVVATSTGTSFGTLIICGPLLYPAGAAAGADPAMLIGAILGGATFGDSISPVSDTTIATAGTQQADIGGTVRARLKYVLPAAGVAVMVALILGAGPVPAEARAAVATASARGLPMALVPALVIALLLGRRHLVEALLGGVIAATGLGLALGVIAPGQLLRIDAESFTARSLVIDGIERGLGVSVFTLLLVALVGALDASGTLTRLVVAAEGRARGARAAEWRIVGLVTAAAASSPPAQPAGSSSRAPDADPRSVGGHTPWTPPSHRQRRAQRRGAGHERHRRRPVRDRLRREGGPALRLNASGWSPRASRPSC
jgi:Na+/H+ antiporter NhaC